MTEYSIGYDIGKGFNSRIFLNELRSRGAVELSKSQYSIQSEKSAGELLDELLKLNLVAKKGTDLLWINAVDGSDAAYFRAGVNSEKQDENTKEFGRRT